MHELGDSGDSRTRRPTLSPDRAPPAALKHAHSGAQPDARCRSPRWRHAHAEHGRRVAALGRAPPLPKHPSPEGGRARTRAAVGAGVQREGDLGCLAEVVADHGGAHGERCGGGGAAAVARAGGRLQGRGATEEAGARDAGLQAREHLLAACRAPCAAARLAWVCDVRACVPAGAGCVRRGESAAALARNSVWPRRRRARARRLAGRSGFPRTKTKTGGETFASPAPWPRAAAARRVAHTAHTRTEADRTEAGRPSRRTPGARTPERDNGAGRSRQEGAGARLARRLPRAAAHAAADAPAGAHTGACAEAALARRREHSVGAAR